MANTFVKLDEEWGIEIDGYFNHIPHQWKEIRKRVKGGSPKDTYATGEYEWTSEGKFFPNMKQTINYIVQKEIADSEKQLTFKEYIDTLETLLKKYEVFIK